MEKKKAAVDRVSPTPAPAPTLPLLIAHRYEVYRDR